MNFGPEIDDLFDVLQARDTWLKGRDVTIPSRRTLSTANEAFKSSQSGARLAGSNKPFAPDPQAAKDLSLRTSIQKQQILRGVEQHEFESLYLTDKPSHEVVLGPTGSQQKFTLTNTLDIGQAWAKPVKQGATQGPGPRWRYHEGWLLNIGEKIQCLSWAPQDTEIQYLALAPRCSSSQRRSAILDDPSRPAFHPSPPYPSSIQIWAFQTEPTGVAGVRTLLMTAEPKISVAFGTRWGNIRHLRWCPPPQPGREMADNTSGARTHPGLLGVISSDGYTRVLAVPLTAEQNETAVSSHVQVERAGITIPPPSGTVFTTIAFASPTDLVVGAADGSIHLFDLAEAINADGVLRSYMTHQLHNTYVVSLCTASPGPFSSFVASISASGDLVLTDLRSPEQDKVSVPRACFPNRDLFYSPFTRSFLTALDRAGNTHFETQSATFVICHHLRQFHTGLRIAKLPDYSGAATALAGSHLHPCILVGNAQGQVLATNYLRKVLPYKRVDPRKATGAYLQKITEYEWRRRPPTAAGEGRKDVGGGRRQDEAIDLFHGRDVRPGVSRFHEGFKPEKIEVGNVLAPRKKAQKRDLGATEAIFEEEQAVTALDWNLNASCAGLSAVGWGSGIVRVQDLAHGME